MKKSYLRFFSFLLICLSFNLTFGQKRLADSRYNEVVNSYLENIKGEYGFTANDFSDLYINHEVYSKKSNLTHLYLNQRYQGIEIFNAISSVALRDNSVFYYANNLIGDIAQKINAQYPSINAQAALQKVAMEFNLGNLQGLEEIGAFENEITFNNAGISRSNIPVKLVYFYNQEANELKLAWDVSVEALDGNHWWSIRVDAQDGSILDTADWVLSCNFGEHVNHSATAHGKRTNEKAFSLFKAATLTADGSEYNVYPYPVESPNHGSRSLLSEPSNDIASPYGWHDTDGVAGAEHTITRGNNVWAQEDQDGNNGTGYAPDGLETLSFDFPLDFEQQPAGYVDAAITNLFYANNMMHDVWYQYGFDEASGNFQSNNYGNGGAGNDYVFADGQDGSGMNNATFGTPPDGSNPSMRMFLWDSADNAIPQPLTINTGDLAGGYIAALPATGPGNNITGPSSIPVTADLVVVDDGTGAPTEGCNALVNGADVTGKIAVIKRGNCTFVDKIQNAQDAGAVAVIMVNHNNPTNDPDYVQYVTMAGQSDPAFTIPSIFVNNADGQPIIDALLGGETINATIVLDEVFNIDGSLDNGVMAHEYGHGISNRLTGGANNTGCLGNAEQMGEGWSDWVALMMTMKSTDQPTDAKAIATFVLAQDTDGSGLRPAPYSTDFAINDFTYGATNDDTVLGTINGEEVSWNEIVHNIGFVWATMLWDLTWAYVDKYGFDPDLMNGDGGNNKVMQVVMDGMKLQPCSPGFVTGRNAILQADMALTGGEDQCLIWEVFANRGLGAGASQGLPFLMTDQVEDFSMPDENDETLQNCTSLSVEDFNFNQFNLYPNPTNGMLYIKTATSVGNVTLTLTDMNGRSVLTQQANLVDAAQVDMSQLQSGIYILNIKGTSLNVNKKIVKK
ncbi:T9SS-dependent M36 family metallopeptidase [Mangrovimonas sp. ST2L15]|uniref:T9SS-dependent M36 family metallopeptidase n=1 Tax=Mangrovimonas sp. ST2L15 TaxID=1645916 RepID=UPI0006B48EBE|nr:T9SS-dependent M36 family metallopeptidase [Mangrovimonas sp. ST2L15]